MHAIGHNVLYVVLQVVSAAIGLAATMAGAAEEVPMAVSEAADFELDDVEERDLKKHRSHSKKDHYPIHEKKSQPVYKKEQPIVHKKEHPVVYKKEQPVHKKEAVREFAARGLNLHLLPVGGSKDF